MKNVLSFLTIPVFLLCSFQKEDGGFREAESRIVSAPVKSERIIYLFLKQIKTKRVTKK
jgi:hypothetical protein